MDTRSDLSVCQAPSPASFRPPLSTERPDSFWTYKTQTRPSTAPSISSKSGSMNTLGNRGRLMVHALTNRPALDDQTEPTPPVAMSSTRSPVAVQTVERGRPLAQVSSWSSLRFITRKSSKDSLRDDSQDATGNRNQTARRFQSLGFLRKKGSSTSVAHCSSTSLTSKPSSSSQGGHSTTNSNSSNGSQPHTAQVPAVVKVKQHVIPASIVFPGTTFNLTLMPSDAPPSSPEKVTSVPSFARPQKANPVIRRSISLYENVIPKKNLSDLTASAQRFGKKRTGPLPPTKTTTVARAPCAYDVTRSFRPRSSSLPLNPVSSSREEHVVASAATENKDLAAVHLNTSTSDPSLSTMATTSPPPSDRAIPQRAQHRFAAVYRPPPPLDANGYVRPGHPKPALSLSMPSGVSIIEPLSPPAPALAKSRTRDDSPSPLDSANSSSRPPPKAPIPVSPGTSPEIKSAALPPASRSFGSPSALSVPSGNHWSRPGTPSATKPPAIISNRTADKGSLELNYNIKLATTGSRLPNTSQGLGANGPSSYNSNKSNSSDRIAGSLPRTIYSASPSIPINSRRRPSLPLTPVLQEQAEQSMDQVDQLWGYFEKNGLASSGPQSRSTNGPPFIQTMHLLPPHTPQTPSSLRTPPLTGGVSPISPFSTRPLATQRPAVTDNVDRLTTRPTQTQPPQRPERVRPKHLISQSSSAALPSPLPSPHPWQSFLPSPAPSTSFNSPFPSPAATLPVTPVTPEWVRPSTDADSVIPSLTPHEKVDRWFKSSQ